MQISLMFQVRQALDGDNGMKRCQWAALVIESLKIAVCAPVDGVCRGCDMQLDSMIWVRRDEPRAASFKTHRHPRIQ